MAAFPPRLTVFAVVCTLLVAGCSTPADTLPAAASDPGPDAARYHVDLRATRGGAEWTGTGSISFRNATGAPVSRIWLRLWANGVQGCRPRAVRISGVEGGRVGEIRRACTAVAIDLDEPVAAGDRTAIAFSLTIRVPERNDRFGRHGGITLVGGGLPILAVRDAAGWHLDPYVDLGESFYSLASRYRVSLDVPERLRTAATGRVDRVQRHGDRVRRWYTAEGVREFAFAAARFDRITGRAGGTRISVWFHPLVTTERQAERMLADARRSMATFSEAFGPYHGSEIDLVATGFTTFGGMEYPQIVFSNPDRLTVAHELAHQWWWAIVGNDQYAEPWLDESLATWSMRLPFSPWKSCNGYDWPRAQTRLTNDMSYWGDHPAEYGTIYAGGGCMLAALAHEMGVDAVVRALADHAAANRLGVTDGEEFRGTVEAVAATEAPGLDMSAFWEEWRATG
jgi:hypothetical protein